MLPSVALPGQRLQPPVANRAAAIATFRIMEEKWGSHWRLVCAPKLLERKEKLGRAVPEVEIAAFVESETGKPSGRALVWRWLHGEREPFVSQFLALCQKLGVEPNSILDGKATAEIKREPLFSTKPKRARAPKSSRRRRGG